MTGGPAPLPVVPFIPRVFHRLGMQRLEVVSPRGGLEADFEGEYWTDTENELVFVEWGKVTVRVTGRASVYAGEGEIPELKPAIRKVRDAVDLARFVMRTSEGTKLWVAHKLDLLERDPFEPVSAEAEVEGDGAGEPLPEFASSWHEAEAVP